MQNDGIEITSYIREQMRMYRTGGDSDQPMSLREVSLKVGISHSKWDQAESGKLTFCSWETWASIYKVLTREKLLDPNDIELMPPAVLYEYTKKLLREQKQSDGNINNGINNGVIGDNNKQVKAEENKNLDEFKNEVVSNIAGSDMCSDCRKKAVKLVMEAYDFVTF